MFISNRLKIQWDILLLKKNILFTQLLAFINQQICEM